VIADLHAHFAMHLVGPAEDDPHPTLSAMRRAEGRLRRRDRLRAHIVGLLSRFMNYPSLHSGPRVTIPLLREGGVRVVLSMLYSPFDEMDLHRCYGEAPQPDYFATLIRQLDLVEDTIATRHGDVATVARSPEALDAALAGGATALVHAVEGGFALGATPAEVDANVATLARRGVAYVTLAHLFWRGVATDAPAIPFLPDWLYRLLFPQPRNTGLTELGEAAVRAMVREGVLVDVAHMSARATEDTLALLDEIDGARRVPVIASHAGYRFGGQEYMLGAETVQRIAARGGVVGLILAEHQICDGLRPRPTRSLADTAQILGAHVDHLYEITGSHAHTAIGSDLDGFIKPTLHGLQTAADLRILRDLLAPRVAHDDLDAILFGNVMRVLRAGWRRTRWAPV
jgi:microsomal dipeptidase-like Zn-dependent dipeptidase